MAKKNQTLQATMESELAEKFREYSAKKDRSISYMIRKLIIKELGKK